MSNSSQLAANQIHTTYRAALLQLADAISPYPFLREKENALRAVADNLQAPFNVAIFGRMKTGKSTLINALIGHQLAITGVEEATATINLLTYATDERLKQFTVHWHDAQPETFPLERLQQDWSGKTPAVLNRIARAAWLELYSNAPALKDIHITDTPGTGATAAEHEVIAKQFINGQTADALLYVFSPTGRESDIEDLQAFRKGCLEGSSMDNCVAVVHKWDSTYWDEDNWDSIQAKADLVQNFMEGLVSAVIPVSGPLALISKTASASFWQRCTEVLSTFASERDLREMLNEEEDWEEDDKRDALYREAKALGCPLASFRVMLREMYRHPGEDPKTLIYKLSGFRQLTELLDRQIFSMRSVIQQKQNCARARKVMDAVYQSIETELEHQQDDIDMMNSIYNMLSNSCSTIHQRWIDAKCAEMKLRQKDLRQAYRNLDTLRLRIKYWADAITNAHDLIPWLNEYEKLGLNQETALTLSAYLKALLPNAESSQDLTMEKLAKLLPLTNRLTTLPCVEDKIKAEKLCDCLMQWVQQHQG